MGLSRSQRAALLSRLGKFMPAMKSCWDNWTLELDYSKYHLVQDTGAFGADAGRFAFTYHF